MYDLPEKERNRGLTKKVNFFHTRLHILSIVNRKEMKKGEIVEKSSSPSKVVSVTNPKY